MPITSFRDLRVWQASMDLVEQTYQLVERFPRKETYGLAAQMQRAAVSVPANIAEGFSRGHTAEYLRFIGIAHASLAELETHLEIARRVRYVDAEQAATLLADLTILGRQLHSLQLALSRRLAEQASQSPFPTPQSASAASLENRPHSSPPTPRASTRTAPE